MRSAPPQAAPTIPTPELLCPRSDRDLIDRDLADFLAESRRRHAANPHVRPLYERSAEFVLHGGKRLRPRLCLAGYRIVSGRLESPPRPVRLAAASLELFHAFMLVHDDIIDASAIRRDRPTVHEAIRLDADDPACPEVARRASDLGIVAGDLLCALGMRLLATAGLDDAPAAAAHRLVADVLLETGVGEALDILYGDCPLDRISEPQILDAYLRKTARYSVSGPLILGATLAGAGRGVIRAVQRFGDLLGLGYQLQNDLDALRADPIAEENPDLDGGKRTWVLWMAHHRLGPAGRDAMADALEMPAGPDRRARLFALIESSGAIAEGYARLQTLRAEAVEALRQSTLTPAQRQAFLGLVALFAPPTPATAEPMFLAPAAELAGKATA